MNKTDLFVVFETPSVVSEDDIRNMALALGAEHYAQAVLSGNTGQLKILPDGAEGLFPDKPAPLVDLYGILFQKRPEISKIVRIRGFVRPWTDILWKDMLAQCGNWDYILYTADEIYPAGFFMEILTESTLEKIGKLSMPLMPSGYFNGMTLKSSCRIVSSPGALKATLGKRFKEFLPEPRLFSIDIMPACNYACLKCHYHSPLLPPQGSCSPGAKKVRPGSPMNPELLGRVLHHAKFWKSLKDLHFYMSGEPLMHPEIAKMCIVANELGYKPAFSSNGALLDDKMAEKMLAAGVTYIGFSIDSLDPGLYRKLQGGDLWEIERKIMRWQELCLRKTGSFSGSIMCVLGEENRNEAEDFFRIWTARGFTVLFNYELDVHTREMLGATHKLTRIGPCANPRFLFLDSGANVLLCPAQLNGSNINAPGFLSRHPEEIWLDPERSRFLQRLLEGERLDFCFQCSGSALMANGTWTCRKEQPIYESECGWYGAPPDNWRTLKGWQG